MSLACEALWINTTASLRRFDQPLLGYLSQHLSISEWQYVQSPDEPSDLEIPVQMLHEYLHRYSLQRRNQPVHLLGHGTGGLVALLYARRFPEVVRSLTLLAIGAQVTLDWIAHYYFHLQFLPCSRHQVLHQLVRDLFGPHNPTGTQYLIKLLLQALAVSPSPNSLLHTPTLPLGGVPVPLLVCGSQDDVIVDPHELQGWQPFLQRGDRLWHCPQGRHFFHQVSPQLVGHQILDFWQLLSIPVPQSVSLAS